MFVEHARHSALLREGQMAQISRETGAYIYFPGGSSGYDSVADPQDIAELASDPRDIVKIRGTSEGCKKAGELLQAGVIGTSS
jgi:hypothetical protein